MALPPSTPLDANTRIQRLRSQYEPGLLGVPCQGLRLSWVVASDDPSTRQLQYQLASAGPSGHWEVHEPVASADSVGIGPADTLAPGTAYRFAVRIATGAGWTEWCAPLTVETGLTGPELTARVIGVDSEVAGPVPVLRREFTLDAVPSRARLRLSALGVVDAWINGRPATDAVLTPGWTAYNGRILVDTIDVTPLLTEGVNTVVFAVGDGWYRGRLGFIDHTCIYGDQLGVLAQLELTTETGDLVVATDDSWTGGFGAIRSAGIYDGSEIDLTLDLPGLHQPGFTGDFSPVVVREVDLTLFEPRTAPPVRRIAEFPMAVDHRPDRVVLDAGQNISGWVRLTVRGRAGDVVTVRHAEILDPAGDLYTVALRSAKATDSYVLGSDGEHVLEPALTFHGFQYADVTGPVEVLAATAVAISADLPRRSSFRSSHPALDQFHSNAFWSLRDNFVSVPTDCPQRDERLGWTGDAQAISATAATMLDSEVFWASWLRDLEIDQTDAGGVACIVPNIIRPGEVMMGGGPAEDMGRAGWADAATIVPLAVHESYGSDEVLAQQLGSMRRWVEHLRRRAGDEVLLPAEGFQFGDWLDPDAPGDQPWAAKVNSYYVANAFYAHSARLLARAERVVGDAERAASYEELADRVAAATWQRWGEDAIATQTGAALALEFRIAPEDRRAEIGDLLAANVRAENGRIATGFLGTPVVLYALKNAGHLDEAFLMVLRREAPSWLYQVDRGATTVWERWDAILPDGSIHTGEMDTREGDSMLSFNHYAYGAMIDWVYRTVAGLAPDQDDPGYRTVHVAPRPAAGIDHASAEIETRLGRLAIDWRLGDDGFEAELVVPFGARAVLDLPVTGSSTVTVNGLAGPDAPAELTHGSHRITVTQPAVALA